MQDRTDKPWTPEEEERLLHMKNVQRLSYRRMATELGRSRDAMQKRLQRLKLLGVFVVDDAGNSRLWPEEFDGVVKEMRLKGGLKYSDIAKWLNTQGVEITAAKVKNGIRHRVNRENAAKPAHERPQRDLRLPYEPGHPITWGALNSLLPNVVPPLQYVPGV